VALNYTTIPIRDFGSGIDQQSSENQIQEGFSEDLLNCDPKPEGYLVKRKGYQGFAGSIPLRVSSFEAVSSSQLCFTFDSNVNLSQLSSSPVVVYGRAGNFMANGDFTTAGDTVEYYSGFTLVSSAQTVSASSSATLNLETDTTFTFTHVALSTSLINNSNEPAVADRIELDTTGAAPYSIDIDITNGNTSDIDLFLFTQDKSPETGVTFVGSDSGALTSKTIPTGGITSFTITAGTHALDDFSIIGKVYQDTGTSYVELTPESLDIDGTTGDVTISVNNLSGSSIDVFAILTAAPIANSKSLSVAASSSNSTIIANLDTDFPVFAVYE